MTKVPNPSIGEDLSPEDAVRWLTLFVDELRMRGATGSEVGEARATVEAHCNETGEIPLVAFGDPVAYARALRPNALNLRHMMTVAGATLLGCLAGALAAGMPWQWSSAPVAVSWGNVAQLVVWAALFPLVLPVAPLQKRHPARGSAVLFALLVIVQLAAQALRGWTTIALHLPALALWGLAAVAALSGCVLACRVVRDRVIDPRTGQTPSMVPAFWWWVLGAMPLWGPGAILFFRWLAHS